MIEIFQLIIVVISIPMLLYFVPYSLKYRDLKSLKFLTIVLMMQNILSLFSSNVLSGQLAQLMILYKDIILWGVVILYALSSLKIKISIVPLLLFGLYIFTELFQGAVDVYTKLVCFRQLVTPVVLVIYGRALRLNYDEIVDYTIFVVKLGFYQAIFGLIERFILGDEFWLAINISALFENKGFSKWVLSGLPGNYYSYDFYYSIGDSIKRLVGVTTDPLLTVHYLALCLVILIFSSKNEYANSNIMYIILLVATILTLSKGGLLIIVVAYIYKASMKNKILAYMCGIIAMSVLFIIIQSDLLRTIAIHILGVTSAFVNVSLFGQGLGTSGNLASLGAGSLTAGESFWGMILGQIGIVGLILFCFMIYVASKFSLKYNKGNICYATVAYVVAVMIEGILSESAINYVGSGCGFILLGLLSKKRQFSEKGSA